MINLDWKKDITSQEISNDLKRWEFLRNEKNWKIIYENKYPRIFYKQLRGTDLIKIEIPSLQPWASSKTKSLGGYYVTNYYENSRKLLE